jgi:hypothetical protein
LAVEIGDIWAKCPKLRLRGVPAMGRTVAMQIFWWVVLGLAATCGLLKFFLDVHATALARKEGLRLAHHLAERITEDAPEPLESDPSDARVIASVEHRAVHEADRQAA